MSKTTIKSEERRTGRFFEGADGDAETRTEPGPLSARQDREINRVGDRLSYATSNAQDQLRAYRNFQRTRGRWDEKALPSDRWIVRGADSPESHVMTFSILAAMILFEGLMNAYFFSKGSDLGLLGGWIQAITVAFTNVIAAFFLIGFLGVRMLQNPDRPFSFAAALVITPVAAAFILFLNFTAAHYRDLLELNAATLALGGVEQTGEILAPVTRALTFQPVETLEALLLLGLGVTFAAIAAFKGATFDDRLMGYGAVERRFNRALSSLEQALKQVKPETRVQAATAPFEDPRYGTVALAMHVKTRMIDYKLELESLAEARMNRKDGDDTEYVGSHVKPPVNETDGRSS